MRGANANIMAATSCTDSDSATCEATLQLMRLLNQVRWPEGVSPVSSRLSRVWAGKKGRITCEHLVLLRTPTGSAEYSLQGVFGPVASGISPSMRAKLGQGLLLGLVLVDDGGGVWWASPDKDPQLSALRAFFEAETGGIADAALNDPAPAGVRFQMISYRVGRRCVIRACGRKRRFYVKIFRRMPSGAKIRRWRWLADVLAARSCGAVCVPRILHYAPRLHLTVSPEVPGTPGPLGYTEQDQAMASGALAVLHSVPCPMDESLHSPDDELSTVARWCGVLQRIAPRFGEPVAALCERIRADLPQLDIEDTSMIHRDFYHGQLLATDQALWIVDLDTVCRGHRELDLATYFAHAVLDRAAASEPASMDDFLSAYVQSGGKFDRNRLNWYCACALTRLFAMYAARGHQSASLEVLRLLAERCLDSLDPWARRRGSDSVPTSSDNLR